MSIVKASIYLTWDRLGRLRHHIEPHAEIRFSNAAERVDFDTEALSSSVPILISSQLGILRPAYALACCSDLIASLRRDEGVTCPINSAVKSARIDLRQGAAGNVFHTFRPKTAFLARGDSIEDGIRQLLTVYPGYVLERVPKDFGAPVRVWLAVSIIYYLDKLADALQDAGSDMVRAGKLLYSRRTMANWSARLYQEMTERGVDESQLPLILEQAEQKYREVYGSTGT